MSEPVVPDSRPAIAMNVDNRAVARFDPLEVRIEKHSAAPGVVIYSPAGYWEAFNLLGLRKYVGVLTDWLNYLQALHKPKGWRLKSIEGKVVDITAGQSVKLIGDSFVVVSVEGTPLSEAYPALEWTIEPIIEPNVPA